MQRKRDHKIYFFFIILLDKVCFFFNSRTQIIWLTEKKCILGQILGTIKTAFTWNKHYTISKRVVPRMQ